MVRSGWRGGASWCGSWPSPGARSRLMRCRRFRIADRDHDHSGSCRRRDFRRQQVTLLFFDVSLLMPAVIRRILLSKFTPGLFKGQQFSERLPDPVGPVTRTMPTAAARSQQRSVFRSYQCFHARRALLWSRIGSRFFRRTAWAGCAPEIDHAVGRSAVIRPSWARLSGCPPEIP